MNGPHMSESFADSRLRTKHVLHTEVEVILANGESVDFSLARQPL